MIFRKYLDKTLDVWQMVFCLFLEDKQLRAYSLIFGITKFTSFPYMWEEISRKHHRGILISWQLPTFKIGWIYTRLGGFRIW